VSGTTGFARTLLPGRRGAPAFAPPALKHARSVAGPRICSRAATPLPRSGHARRTDTEHGPSARPGRLRCGIPPGDPPGVCANRLASAPQHVHVACSAPTHEGKRDAPPKYRGMASAVAGFDVAYRRGNPVELAVPESKRLMWRELRRSRPMNSAVSSGVAGGRGPRRSPSRILVQSSSRPPVMC